MQIPQWKSVPPKWAMYLIAVPWLSASGETVPTPPAMLSVDGIMATQTATSESSNALKVLLNDDVEHGECLKSGEKPAAPSGYPAYFVSTCSDNQQDGITVISEAARRGSWGYELAVTEEGIPISDSTEGIHVAKMTATTNVTDNQHIGAKLRYEGWFNVKSGFNDDAWHIQMQWKAQTSAYSDEKRYWLGQNPKVSLGFRRRNGIRQVEVTVRDAFGGQCAEFAYDRFTRPSTLRLPAIPIPDRQWIKITMEVYFHPKNGSIRVFQLQEQQNAETLIIAIDNINTVSQLIAAEIAKDNDLPCDPQRLGSYYYTQPTNLYFQLANYMSNQSFMSSSESHVLHVDDVKITRLH